MCDIEDSWKDFRETTVKEAEPFIKVRARKTAKESEDVGQMDSFVPGTKKIWIKTWGCSHNASDTEYMAGLISQAGYNLTENREQADLWLLNSCTVKTPSEMQANYLLEEGQKKEKAVVMAGCVSQAAPNETWLKGISIVGVKQIDRVVEVVEETLKGNMVRLLSRKREDAQLSLPKMRKNPLIEVLAINTGCLNHCTYCKTKMARGDLKSYPLEELVEQAKRAFEEGVKELWLTSEDLGAWGRDKDMVLPDLLNELVKVIPSGCMMRLGMTNPPYILDHLDEIATILNHPRVYSFLHIPVQSGSDPVLRDMKREYSRAHFEKVADFMIKKVPNVYLATDMICAFPTETQEDFEESMDLVRKYEFPSLFINQYYPRSGTPAARMKKVEAQEAKRRTAEMSKLFRGYRRYTEDRIGEVHEVLVCEMAKDEVHAVGHNKCYEHILVPNPQQVMGKVVKVRITGAFKFHMTSELVDADNGISKIKDKTRQVLVKSALLIITFFIVIFTNMKVYLRLNLVGQRCRGGELMRHKNEAMERAMGGVRECRECRERRRVEGEGERPASGRERCELNQSVVGCSAHSAQSESLLCCMTANPSPWKRLSRSQSGVERQRDGEGFRIRAAAVCVKGKGEHTQILLVSGGKDGRQWVVPGGGVEKDECAEAAALRELMEEAGVKAIIVKELGTFQDDVRKHKTAVFLAEMTEELETWQEGEFGRKRIWMSLNDSTNHVKQSHKIIIDAVALAR
ncbi:hypothetical protein WR25_00158 [Diploscapter pachys]|uniref:Threonylcarbamoyladenosine tRNA methylthiotransferase n=1 Tax=Diploscapter pachys TaxID=2018661 RepID=A0A2A2JLP3_9BILA|nr:hypothetical protein WR25_00158 [Diploscapter pachys]